ncbi:MAG TPA: WhiB family transcriptional regulator [Acidimicrobiia bacterium]|nr:WhiB family transcriptional regulator [Acidimicrobiia bacterium]
MTATAGVRTDLDSWETRAACRYDARALFYPQTGESAPARAEREHRAKRVCAECPVRVECLDYAVHTAQPLGIWGGTTEAERRASNSVH